jgi:hypothetical protein
MNERDTTPTGQAQAEDLVREIEAVLGRRVNDLENDNARLRRTTLLLSIGVIGALALSLGVFVSARLDRTRVAAHVEAHRFVLRDAQGNVRAVLGPTPEGGSRFVLTDVAGRERLRMTLLADGSPGLSFADSEGRSRAVLAFLPDETANLVFADRTGRTRAVFGLMPDESTTLVFADRDGETRVGLGVDPQGAAGLTLFERDGASSIVPAEPVDATAADTMVSAAETPPPATTRTRR